MRRCGEYPKIGWLRTKGIKPVSGFTIQDTSGQAYAAKVPKATCPRPSLRQSSCQKRMNQELKPRFDCPYLYINKRPTGVIFAKERQIVLDREKVVAGWNRGGKEFPRPHFQ